MDTAITIAQIFLAPLDGQTIALPPVLNVVAHVLGGLFTALIVIATLVYVAALLNALRTREGRAMLVRGAIWSVVHLGARLAVLFAGYSAGAGIVIGTAVMMRSLQHPNLNLLIAVMSLSGIVAIALMILSEKAANALVKRIDHALASRLAA